jgi:hypothetical protein
MERLIDFMEETGVGLLIIPESIRDIFMVEM